MKSLAELLSQLKERELSSKFVLNCTLAQTRVLKLVSSKSVRSLVSKSSGGQGSYGHGVELVRNLALWPVLVRVESSLAEGQLCYKDTPEPHKWLIEITIQPNRGSREIVGLLECEKKLSGRDGILVTFSNQRGDADSVFLEVMVD